LISISRSTIFSALDPLLPFHGLSQGAKKHCNIGVAVLFIDWLGVLVQ
jgi:hypothetical protein